MWPYSRPPGMEQVRYTIPHLWGGRVHPSCIHYSCDYHFLGNQSWVEGWVCPSTPPSPQYFNLGTSGHCCSLKLRTCALAWWTAWDRTCDWNHQVTQAMAWPPGCVQLMYLHRQSLCHQIRSTLAMATFHIDGNPVNGLLPSLSWAWLCWGCSRDQICSVDRGSTSPFAITAWVTWATFGLWLPP